MIKIQPVLLCGGSGKRLWPLSRKSHPKQFSKVNGETTMFQASALRVQSSEIAQFEPPMTLTNSDFRFLVKQQLSEFNIDHADILIEPESKNTSAAILAASLHAYSRDHDAILLVTPSDHVIPDIHNFHRAITCGLTKVLKGAIAVFGIEPSHPETGYGYLKVSRSSEPRSGCVRVEKFIEKPDLWQAKQFLSSGDFLWNAGIFLFRAKDMIQAFEQHSPESLVLVRKSVNNATIDLGFLHLESTKWSELEDISIDNAIMEKIENIVAVRYDAKWSDLGGWDAIWAESTKDPEGNAASDRAHVVGCTNTLLRTESEGQQIIGLGLNNVMAVAMSDAVLVANMDQAQNVKIAVDLLKARGVSQAETYPKDYRPWGWFESLIIANGFQVKRISVSPKSALSLQSHRCRSEHWIVVEGTAQVEIDDVVQTLIKGQSTFIPLGAKHRLTNTTDEPLLLIEVQLGDYLGEDDIIRYEDIYART